MTAQAVNLSRQLRALWAARAAGTHGAIARAAATALAVWPETLPPTVSVAGIRHPVAEHLAAALSASAGGPLTAGVLAALREAAPALPWKYNYTAGRGGDADGGRVAWAELIGPAAPFRSRTLCVGVTLIAPLTLYPAHRHPAAELYGVLSGAARWQSPAADGDRAPGDFIYHEPNAVHAMETHGEPLLAAYTWTGDVQTLSEYV